MRVSEKDGRVYAWRRGSRPTAYQRLFPTLSVSQLENILVLYLALTCLALLLLAGYIEGL